MLGYTLGFINSNNEEIEISEVAFTESECKKLRNEGLEWLEEDMLHKVKVYTNEYWGNREDYDYNSTIRAAIYTRDMFLDTFYSI